MSPCLPREYQGQSRGILCSRNIFAVRNNESKIDVDKNILWVYNYNV